ncbi:magnesium chelatase subunit D family protein [Gephyromycinifex aptenodytis]|uniref:magnesium chelatase subunit D family protein n=1 Tax=Gephyromycinifex aptenodytis TaxID=2716227 RepID=UPI0014465462|nr:magnesium chelatase subunit D family protein [Gephyromycinifex aptenodytis]
MTEDLNRSTHPVPSPSHRTPAFPFSAVVGMDDMGLALCLVAVSPGIGGVLVRGEKGTAKSTMVRALAQVLPPVQVVPGCRFSCDPANPDPDCLDGPHGSESRTRPVRLVELPVGATEDRVVGSLHLDELLAHSRVVLDPGLLAQAHRGILYVDEVNLLPDHLVDTLLDSAAMGRSRVEREGVSVTHAARFVLVGTMNPEEGELRPQLLDRFGLAAEVSASRDVDVRVEVVRRRMAYEADPVAFEETFAAQQKTLADRITRAEELLPQVQLSDEAVRTIATICARFDVDGMRGDLVTARTACAHAAWCGRTSVTGEDIRVAARLALPHRRRRTPFDDQDGSDLEDILDEHIPPDDDPEGPEDPPPGDDGDDPDGDDPGEGDSDVDDGGDTGDDAPERPESAEDGNEAPQQSPPPPPSSQAEPAPESPPQTEQPPLGAPAPATTATAAGSPFKTRLFSLPHAGSGVAGRRSSADVTTGRHVRAVRPEDPRGRALALTSTVIAAASRLGQDQNEGIEVIPGDLRRSVRRGKEGNLVVFAVDTSGSMGAAARIREVKTACVSLLLDAYQRRDKVAVITFAKREANLVLPPTSSVDLATRLLSSVPTGGRTPLAEGLTQAYELIRRERVRDPHRRALLVVLTDGRASAGGRSALPRAHRVAAGIAQDAAQSGALGCVVVDCESDRAGFRLGLARDLAAHLHAEYLMLNDLHQGLAGVA